MSDISSLEKQILDILEEDSPQNSSSLKEYLYNELIETFKNEVDKDRNQPYIVAYNNIVDKTATFMNSELLIEDPIAAAIAFEYILWNGYLSKDNEFYFRLEERINNFSGFGADIMRGIGVCLNNASMLSDVLNKMDYTACPSVCYVHAPNGISKYKKDLPLIERKVYKPKTASELLKYLKLRTLSCVLSPVTKRFGNHAIVLNEYNGKFFATDPTNLCFMTYQGENRLTSLNGTIDFELKPGITGMLNSDIYEEIVDMYNKARNSINEPVPFLENEMIKDYYREQIDICNSKKSLLEDFHNECLEDIDTVCKTLSKNKN